VKARPAHEVCPTRPQLAKQTVDDGLWSSRQPITECIERRQRQVMLVFQDVRQQLVLAFEV